jgi:hypothetical protein
MRMGGGRSEGANPGPLPPQGSALPGLFYPNELSPLCPEFSPLREPGTMGFTEDW